jgi:Tat protein secretion system quality control protein TatD with DNase activity
MVPENMYIHFHCWTYDFTTYKKWSKRFHNMFVGLSPLVLKSTEVQKVAKEMPTNRILLETDAPFLPVSIIFYKRNEIK